MTREGNELPGTKPGSQALFLERRGYRRRRLMDAARLLPILGTVLFMIPLLWPRSDGGNDIAEPGVSTSGAYLYIFVAWGGLIACAAMFGYILRRWGEADGPQGPGQG